jgi:hypothetical protein
MTLCASGVLGCFWGRAGEEEGEGDRLRGRERRDMMGERKKGGNGARLICWRGHKGHTVHTAFLGNIRISVPHRPGWARVGFPRRHNDSPRPLFAGPRVMYILQFHPLRPPGAPGIALDRLDQIEHVPASQSKYWGDVNLQIQDRHFGAP